MVSKKYTNWMNLCSGALLVATLILAFYNHVYNKPRPVVAPNGEQKQTKISTSGPNVASSATVIWPKITSATPEQATVATTRKPEPMVAIMSEDVIEPQRKGPRFDALTPGELTKLRCESGFKDTAYVTGLTLRLTLTLRVAQFSLNTFILIFPPTLVPGCSPDAAWSCGRVLMEKFITVEEFSLLALGISLNLSLSLSYLACLLDLTLLSLS